MTRLVLDVYRDVADRASPRWDLAARHGPRRNPLTSGAGFTIEKGAGLAGASRMTIYKW